MISEDKKQGYLDGYEAALNTVRNVVIRVAPEIDCGISLGVRGVVSILERNLKVLKDDL